ncbi:MAG: tRNA 2-selenouridine(34) synthase MnmH [Pseudomonadota bacterium]
MIDGRSAPPTISELLLGNATAIDLRSPGEFQRSRAPHSINLPLLTDAERARVGVTFKQQGPQAAIRVGKQLVAGEVRRSRVDGWLQLVASLPNPVLMCWRGGLRSSTVARWLMDAGWSAPVLAGGYKAVRQHCLALLESFARKAPIVLIGGRTGTGKTEVLTQLSAAIDLEGIAQHRGSAFGQVVATQPTPPSFENALAAAWLEQQHATHVFLEDEGRTIGRLGLPVDWFAAMQRAPIVLLEASLEERVTRIRKEYIDRPSQAGQSAHELERRFTDALHRIERRLGGLRHRKLLTELHDGFQSGDHDRWITSLLAQYYDPSYDYQLAHKQERIVFTGNAREVIAYAGQMRLSGPSAFEEG